MTRSSSQLRFSYAVVLDRMVAELRSSVSRAVSMKTWWVIDQGQAKV